MRASGGCQNRSRNPPTLLTQPVDQKCNRVIHRTLGSSLWMRTHSSLSGSAASPVGFPDHAHHLASANQLAHHLEPGASRAFAIAPTARGFSGAGPAGRLFTWCNGMRQRIFGTFFGDSVIFIRRKDFDVIGGFPDVPIMEDYELCCRMRRQGRVVRLPLEVMSSNRRYCDTPRSG